MSSASLPSGLKDYLTPDCPLGPIDSSHIADPEIGALLFDTHNRLYSELEKNPSIIVGRRGAGKTAYLRSVIFSKSREYIIEISANKAFNSVISSIQNLSAQTAFPEDAAEIWNKLFHIALFNELVKSAKCQSHDLRVLSDYLAKTGMTEAADANEIVWRVSKILKNSLTGIPKAALEILTSFDDIKFTHAKQVCYDILKKNNQSAVLLIDSLDGYDLNNLEVIHAIRGLLKCAGEFNRPAIPFDLRLCVPAERYHEFMDISSNPLKDFQSELTLHWHAKELLLYFSALSFRNWFGSMNS